MNNTFCCLCLVMEEELYDFKNSDVKMFIKRIINEISNVETFHDDLFICYECKALLGKTYNFIQKVITAQQILHIMHKESNEITIEHLNTVNRPKLGIDTNLTKQEIFNFDICCNVFKDNDKDMVDGRSKSGSDCKSENNDDESIKEPTDDDDLLIEKKIKSRSIKKHNEQDDEDYKVNGNKKKYVKKKRQKRKDDGQTVAIKKKPTTYVMSNFMLNLPAYHNKKRESCKKYVNSDKESDSSAAEQINLDLKKRAKKTPEDCEFNPEEGSSDGQSDEEYFLKYSNLYNSGRERTKPRDLRTYPMKCDHCDFEIPEKRVHYHHYLFYHPKIQYPYSIKDYNLLCQFCGKAYKNKYLHATHELSHSSEKTLVCPKCPQKFFNRPNLLRHMYSTHTKKFYECHHCGKRMKTRSDIMIHIRIHTGEKPHKCHICGAGFAHKGNVGIHIRSKHQGLHAPKPKKSQSQIGSKTGDVSTDDDEPLVNIKKKKYLKRSSQNQNLRRKILSGISLCL